MQILMLLPTNDRTLELLECEGHFVSVDQSLSSKLYFKRLGTYIWAAYSPFTLCTFGNWKLLKETTDISCFQYHLNKKGGCNVSIPGGHYRF